MGYFYLGLSFLGAVLPYSLLGQFLLAEGLSLAELKTQAMVNPVSGFLAVAWLIAGLVTICFIWTEGRKIKMKGLWLPLIATAASGVSCGLPLFLYLRDLNLSRQPAPEVK